MSTVKQKRKHAPNENSVTHTVSKTKHLTHPVNRLWILLAVLLFIGCSQQEDGRYLVTDYGAKGDGKTLNTKAIQQAIDEASDNGGGVVIIPHGTFVSGTIYLKDSVTLHVRKGATLLGSSNLSHYPVNELQTYRSYTERYSKSSLIYAEDAQHITLRGEGVIDGNGDCKPFQDPKEDETKPLGIRLVSCKHVEVRDLKLQNAGLWMQHYLNCENLSIQNISVHNHGNFTNDGLNIDGCRHVRVSDCYIHSHDDAIALKSTGPSPCQDITITNCVAQSHCHGIKMGTESTGGFKRINISNCAIRASDIPAHGVDRVQVITAIALEIVDGGTMEDIHVNNITAEHVFSPIFIKLGNRGRKHKPDAKEPGPGKLRDITISNLTATNAGPFSSSITGFPEHYVKNVTLQNIRISHYGGGKEKEIMETVPENEGDYPEMKMFGNDWHGPRLPSYGFFIRHVKNLTMDNVTLRLQSPDARKPVYLEDVHNIKADEISSEILPENI